MVKVLVTILFLAGYSSFSQPGVLFSKPAIAETQRDASATVMEVTATGSPNKLLFI